MRPRLLATLALMIATRIPAFSSPLPEPERVVAEIVTPFLQIGSLHVITEAQVSLAIDGQTFQSETVRSEFWDTRHAFSIDSKVPRNLSRSGFVGSLLQTYDGYESRLLWRDDSFLAIESAEMPQLALVSNPVFLALSFLPLSPESCPLCVRATLKHLNSISTIGELLPPGVVLEQSPEDPDALFLRIPAAPGRDRYEVTVTRSGSAWIVNRIRQWNDKGKVSALLSFSEPMLVYAAPSGFTPSRALKLENWADTSDTFPGGASHVTVQIRIVDLDVLTPLPPAEFTIPTDTLEAATVVNNTTGELLRAASCTEKKSHPDRSNP